MRLACKILLVLVLAAPVEAQRMPIRRGILQSDLDGNQYSITNLAGMDAQNVTVWGRLVVNEFEGSQASREGRIVNVLDYGAEPGPCRPWDDSYNGQDLLPADEAVAAAIAAAKGQSNTVYFPPGIYRFTNDVIYVPAHVNILGAGHFFNQGYSQPNLTNGYTLLWFNNLNSKGLWFTEMGKGNAFAMNFSICGWSGGPVPYAGEQGLLETVDHATFARIGLQVTDTNQSWCGGFFGRNVTVSGFRVGVRCDAGQSVFENCGWGGNVVGFASLGRGDFQQGVVEWYNDPNLNYYWTYALQFIPPAGGWGYAQPDDLALRHCFGGRRRHGLVHFFGAARRISITHDTSFDYCRWGMFSDTSFSVNDTYNEFAFSSAIASTNVITLFGTCNLAMRNTHFIHDAALNNHLNMYGEDMRNVALIEDRGFGSAVILQNVRFYPKSMYESDGYWPVLIKSHFQVKTEVEASGGTLGLYQTMGLGSRRVDYIPMGGRFSPWKMFNVQLYGGQPDPNGPTNFYGRVVPYGTLYAQGGRPDYLSFVTRSNSVGEAAADTNNLYWTRLLQSDPGPLRQRDGVWELPQNYTVDQLTVREGLVGSGTLTATNGIMLPQISNIPTSSIPASSSGVTNWVLMNLGPDYQGGGVFLVATNIAEANAMHVLPVSRARQTFYVSHAPYLGNITGYPTTVTGWEPVGAVWYATYNASTRWHLPLEPFQRPGVTGLVAEVTYVITNTSSLNYSVNLMTVWNTNNATAHKQEITRGFTTNGPALVVMRYTNSMVSSPRHAIWGHYNGTPGGGYYLLNPTFTVLP